MSIADDVRAMIVQAGTLVTWSTQAEPWNAVADVPALITDQPEGRTDVTGRGQRVAQIRVSKQDVAAIGYRDTVTESDGTVWTVIDINRVINDRNAGTWRVVVETGVRGKF